MSGLIRSEVLNRPTVDDLLRQAAAQFVAERVDFAGFDLDARFARLAGEACADAVYRQTCHHLATGAVRSAVTLSKLSERRCAMP